MMIFTFLTIVIRLISSILTLNSNKQFHQKLYSDSLYIVDINWNVL